MKQFIVITTCPQSFPGNLAHSIIGKALINNLWSLDIVNLYDFGVGVHNKIDDTPYGGGPGMIIMAEIIHQAILYIKHKYPEVIFYYTSPRGRMFDQKMATAFSMEDKPICFICGKFEGIDQRVIEYHGIKEISIGNYILTGGELAAMIMIEASVRLLAGVMNNQESGKNESFSPEETENYLEHDQYTKPAIWQDLEVPSVLSSGNHQKIKEWKKNNSEKIMDKQNKQLTNIEIM